MEFFVNLIRVKKEQTKEAQKNLEINCTYVDKDYWIYEGDLDVLEDYGVIFEFIDEGIVGALGGLSKKELRKIVYDTFGIDIRINKEIE